LKKKLLIALSVALLLVLSLGSAVFAADPPTIVDINWSGSGGVGGAVTAGDDATASFVSLGSSNVGNFHAIDPDGDKYGVDLCDFRLSTALTNGTAWLDVSRDDSRNPTSGFSWGSPGQTSYTMVDTDGNAALTTRSTTWRQYLRNYHTTISVDSASWYNIRTQLDNAFDDTINVLASGVASGDGSAILDYLGAKTTALSESTLGFARYGSGVGASFTATGTSGTFGVWGDCGNGATFGGLGLTYGSGTYGFVSNWASSFSIADYSVTVD